MVVSHKENGSLHDLLVRPSVPVAEPDVLDPEAIRGLETHAARHDVLQHAVVVALGDVYFPKPRREVAEEYVDVPSLAGGHLRHEMLHVAQDDESARASTIREVDELSAHPLRAARDPDPLFVQLLLDSNVQVRDDEDVVRHECGLIRDRLEIHVRSNGGGGLLVCPGPALFARRRPRKTARAPPPACSPPTPS